MAALRLAIAPACRRLHLRQYSSISHGGAALGHGTRLSTMALGAMAKPGIPGRRHALNDSNTGYVSLY